MELERGVVGWGRSVLNGALVERPWRPNDWRISVVCFLCANVMNELSNAPMVKNFASSGEVLSRNVG